MDCSRRLVWGLALLALLSVPAGAGEEPYQEIRITVQSTDQIQQILANPNIELMGLGDGDIQILSRPSITADLIARGYAVEIVHPDLEAFYAARQGAVLDYGVWHTYDETVAEIELLHQQFPTITTAPYSIGTTGEGRTIWAIKISDNPNVEENEPAVLHDGMHHAREIMTVEMILHFARYLCENYGTDPMSTFLVDNREIYFVPLLNVDGFVYNELTNPNGGGMWRKNRRNNGGCYGVDNNRNYPFEWIGSGSSTNPCDETYRGPSAGSEPENQALMNLGIAQDFVTHDSWHSVAGLILFPWGYTTAHTPDDDLFRYIAEERARDNGYQIGQAPELLYLVNGGCNDWFYGEQALKPKCFSFCTEISGSGFWPAPAEREGLIAENMHSIIYLTQIAGPAISVEGLAVSGGNGNGQIEPGEAVSLLATIRNAGIFSNLTNVTLRLRCDDPYIVLQDVAHTLASLGPQENYTNSLDPFEIAAEAECPEGRAVTFTVTADADGGLHAEAPFVFYVGQLPAIHANDFENSGEEWTQDATHTAATGAFVRVDPVATTYQPGDDTTPAPGVYAWITAQNPNGLEGTDDVDTGIAASRSGDFDLSAYTSVRLAVNYFMGQRDSGDDPNGDFFRLDVSPNAGGSWVNLVQLGDVATRPDWRNLVVELEDYIPLTNAVRFRVQAADAGPANDIVEGGIDDFYLYDNGAGNMPPSTPFVISPPDGGNVSSPVSLTISNSLDPDGDLLTYGFRVYSDADLTTLVALADGVEQGIGNTTWLTPAIPLGTYYWRAFAEDPYQRSLFTATSSFTVTTVTGAEDLAIGGRASVSAEPNPARSGVQIRYLVPSVTTSRLAVYDPQGRLVRDLPNVPSASGWHEITWDGTDDSGRQVPSGSYWVRLWTPLETRTVRVVRID